MTVKKKVGTATYTTQTAKTGAGYYVGDDGKKIKFIAANAKTATASIGNLQSTVKAETLPDAIEYEFDAHGNVGSVTINDNSIFANKKAQINGTEDVVYNLSKTTGTSDTISLVSGSKNNDHIYFTGDDVKISAAAGNDVVTVNSDSGKVNVDSGVGNDVVYVTGGSSNTVVGGDGNDAIIASGDSISIVGGKGNDTVDLSGGDGAIIDAGAGNDMFVATAGTNANIKLGAGNDTVDVTGTLDGTAYTFRDNEIELATGNDVVDVTNVSGITIKSTGATKSKKGNTNGKVVSFSGVNSKITLGADADEITIVNADNTEVFADAGNDAIEVKSANVLTFEGGVGVDTALMSDATVTNSTFNMGDGNDVISIVGGSGSGNIINTGVGDDKILITDTAMTSAINTGFGNDVVNIFNNDNYKNYTGNVFQYNYGNGNLTIDGFTQSDTLLIAAGGHYTVDSTALSGSAIKVDVGDGALTAGSITLKLADWEKDSDAVITKLNGESTTVDAEKQIEWKVTVKDFGKKSAATTATGTLNGVTVATITGLKTSEEGITKAADLQTLIKEALSDSGDTILIGNAALDSSKTATLTTLIGKGKNAKESAYVLGYAGDVTSSTTTTGSWTTETSVSGSGIKATCGATEISAGYKLSDDKKSLSFVDKSTGDSPIIDGLKAGLDSADLKAGITFKGNEVLLSSSVVDQGIASDTGISIASSGDTKYTLGFGTGMSESKVTAAGWFFDKDADTSITGMLNSADTPAGYYIDDKDGKMYYRNAEPARTLVEINGLNAGVSDADISTSTKKGITTITLGVGAFDTTEHNSISIDEAYAAADYKLAFTANKKKGVVETTVSPASWTVSGTTATYNTVTVKKTGYAVSEDGQSIDYYDVDDDENTLFDLKGVASGLTAAAFADALDVDAKVVTLTKAMLGTTSVTMDFGDDPNGARGSYTLALGEDVDKPEEFESQWNYATTTKTVKKGSKKVTVTDSVSAKYISSGTSAGFTLKEGDQFASYTPQEGGETVVTIKGLAESVKSGDASVSYEDYADKGLISINADTGTTTSKAVEVTIASSIASVASTGITVNGKGAVFELTGGGKLTNGGLGASLVGGAESDTLIGGKGNDYLFAGGSTEKANLLNGGAGNDTLFSSGAEDTLIGGVGKDSLIGIGGGASLNGGSGNDTLNASSGKNTLTGGAGNDIFLYGEGTATITDYTAGTDKIYYRTSKADSGAITAKVDGKNVVVSFGTGEDDKIIIKNGKNKKITFVNADNEGLLGTPDYVKLTGKEGSTTYTLKEGTSSSGGTDSGSGTTDPETNPGTDPLWFDDDNEFVTANSLSNIVDSDLVGEFENYDSGKLNKQENLVTYGG